MLVVLSLSILSLAKGEGLSLQKITQEKSHAEVSKLPLNLLFLLYLQDEGMRYTGKCNDNLMCSERLNRFSDRY